MNLADIIKDSNYKLSQFKQEEVDWLEESIFNKQTKKGEAFYINCLVRKKDIQLKPEEVIRQLYLKVLLERYQYSVSRLSVEYGVNFGREVKRADIVVFDKDRPTVPYIIIEVKKPNLKDGKNQLRSYCNATGAPMSVWTNGDQISYYQRKDPNYFNDISDIPNVHQTLADILNEKFTLEDLVTHDKLKEQRKSLKTLIEEMEDEVLANAGVDVFEEVFKLIFTKLYDEWYSGQGNRRSTRQLEFRNTGQTETALKNKIQSLFDKAKQKWEGVFSEDVKITLTPSHLAVCVSSLEDVKLFNSNLEVVDEAFEYLINQSSKGEKGQFFTPRYVIDMCVKMLNPQEDEYTIDTAAGSSGFPVHTIFYVWKQILEDEGIEASHLFSLENKPPRCEEYVTDKVFAIDFDEKAVRVARTLNLIAGDGQTNVLHLNTLDYELWDEVTNDESWQDIYFEGFKRLKKRRPKGSQEYREFQFDVLMANPPFAGDIKETRIINRYDLGKKPNGKWQNKLGRDILFIERNLDFLKPGGRMAIILPQGRFNNSSDKQIRDYIAEKCRILAVVGLHGNTFKPHTGTKTSVLFVQKWNDNPKIGALCPRQDDYNIFFATMRKSGKDNSGEKIYRRIVPKEEEDLSDKEKNREFLLDPHDHLIVDHDLYNHDRMTEDGIAEAFIEFAKKEKLSFFESSLSVKAFDTKKYECLMDGLEAVEVSFSEVLEDNDSFRFDSEYFKKEYLLNIKLIEEYPKGCIEFGEQILSITGGATPLGADYPEYGIRFLRVQNIMQNYIDDSDLVYITEQDHKILKRSKLNQGDVLLTITGVSYGKSAIVTKDFEECNINQHSVKITLKKHQFLPYFVSTFLNSKCGKLQSDKNIVGVTRPALDYQSIKSFKIPLISDLFQKKIDKLIVIAHQKIIITKRIYSEAEELLLSELGLKDWQPTEENIAVKSFAESFGKSDRLDAEYYQPNQQKIMSIISQSGLCLKNFVNLAKRKFIPEKQDTFNYIEIGNLSGEGFAHCDTVSMDEAPSRAQWIVKQNDVITSTVRPIRRLSALIESEQNNYICSSGFAVLKPVKIQPEVLLVYLRLPIICQILDLHTTASMYPAISTDDLLKIPITLPTQDICQEIVLKVKSSRKAREQSKQLLEIAKTGVEKAIEENEERAIDWINKELKILGVELQ